MQRMTSSPPPSADTMEVALIFLCSMLAPTVLASGKSPSRSRPCESIGPGKGALRVYMSDQ